MDAIKSYFKVMFGTKTGRLTALAIAGTVVSYLNGDLSPDKALAALYLEFQTINIRDAIRKSGPAVKPE